MTMNFRREFLVSPRRTVLAASIIFGFASVTTAHAETGSAHAHDVAIHINVLGLAQLDIDPQAAVGFDNAVQATDQQESLPSLDIGDAVIHLSTSTVASEAQYAPGVSLSAAEGDSRIEQLNLSALGLLNVNLLSITADLIQTQSMIIGYCLPAGRESRTASDDITFFNGFDTGNLTPGGPGGSNGGNVTFVNPGITILDTIVPELPTNPPPNTTVDLAQLGIVGATLVLNEQTITGDGVNMSSISSNALHLTLSSAGVITADVTIGHTDSTLDCTQ